MLSFHHWPSIGSAVGLLGYGESGGIKVFPFPFTFSQTFVVKLSLPNSLMLLLHCAAEDLYKLRRQSLTLRSSGCTYTQVVPPWHNIVWLVCFLRCRGTTLRIRRGGKNPEKNNNAFFKRITAVSPCQMLPHSALRCYQGKKIYSLLSGPNVIKLH